MDLIRSSARPSALVLAAGCRLQEGPPRSMHESKGLRRYESYYLTFAADSIPPGNEQQT